MRRKASAKDGLTLVEVLVVSAVLVVMASAILPLSRVTIKRHKEMELKAALREMRRAIDAYKRMSEQGQLTNDIEQEGYPKDLDELVEGVDIVGQVDKKAKFLRRLPKDPMTAQTEWGKRSYQDEFDSTVWGGQNVYDVYSLSTGTALDGTKYADW
ncbi:MAG: prepilin-type N-terminal cleavage/methylation domain-containing protein [Acidobacteriota bacterium]